MEQYKRIIENVLNNGQLKKNRTGVDTIQLYGQYYNHDMSEGFPLLTTKEISWKNVVVENLWFLSGQPKIDLLRKHGCKFWDPWADEAGYVPSPYGYYWRNFQDGLGHIDQIKAAVLALKKDLNSRRACIAAWDPRNAVGSSLPPCHAFWSLGVSWEPTRVSEYEAGPLEPKLNLSLFQRSCDVGLGLPYNTAGYAFQLALFSKILGVKPGKLHHYIADCHIYSGGTGKEEYNHIPGLVSQLQREPRKLPTLVISDKIDSLEALDGFIQADPSTEEILEVFRMENYDPCPAIRLKPAV